MIRVRTLVAGAIGRPPKSEIRRRLLLQEKQILLQSCRPLVRRQIGAVAQLGERCVRNAEVEGSTPFRSTSEFSSPSSISMKGCLSFAG